MARLKMMGALGAGFITVFLVITPSSVTAALANVSHSYLADGTISSGSLVSLETNKAGYVIDANVDNGKRLTGVAVNPNDSLLAVNPGSKTVQIATTGSVNVLASTVNGNISVGDDVSVSPFNGIGMKANPGLNSIGLAQTSLNSNTPGISKEEVVNKQGKMVSVLVGYVSVTINIAIDDSSGNASLNGLQRLVQNITGHVVPTFRIILSLIVIGITILALIIVTYSAIYGSVVSVGRNPLAKHAIFKTLRSVLFMSSLVALVACAIAYLLLS